MTLDGGPGGHTQCAAIAYDYTVLAGTQGVRGHHKIDRIVGIAARRRLPVVILAEGGGGRPGGLRRDRHHRTGQPDLPRSPRLSGRVPLVGIGAGRCFAGSAALLGMCDVVIATRDATIGMGGPAMIELADR